MRRMRGSVTAVHPHISALLETHGTLTVADMCEMLRRSYGIDLTTRELAKRIQCDPRLRERVTRVERCYWESRGQLPRTDSVYQLIRG